MLEVDGRRGVAETVTEVERLFAGALAAGPVVADETERARLPRHANRATVRQYGGVLRPALDRRRGRGRRGVLRL
ncbi:hypothetical protein [Streptomyces kanamyceticus]|uniref:hypothetical protein n=1 Tax=Streptomyces kanamyceticus TaxID=1967 RepID=UPI0037DC689E